MRKTSLKAEKDGIYRRNIGYLRRVDGKLTQPKLSLGRVKRTAQERLDRIAAIWHRIELESKQAGTSPIWDDLSLKIAKAIAKGEPAFRYSLPDADPETYARIVEAIASCYPEIPVLPVDEVAYHEGKAGEEEKWKEAEAREKSLLTLAADLKAVVLDMPGNDRKYVNLLGDQTLHQALDAYGGHIATDKFDKTEGAVNDTGQTKRSMVKQIKSYVDDVPLQSLTDYASVDRLFGIFRNRPITHRYKTPMKAKTASNLIGEFAQFFDWLHTQPDWDWREPLDYHRISHRPLGLEGDEDSDADDIPTYTVAQLKTLFEYGTPLERLLLLLGVNCAYGADQIGRLRVGEVIEKNGVHYIKRVRRKKKVKGIHRLFRITYEGLQWAIRGREKDSTAHVLVNSKGNPLWRKTKGGNRSRDIPNAWYRLLDRVQQDHPSFPRHGFNTLRDTSANFVRRIGGEGVASAHLTHRHQHPDRNLRRYTNVPWKVVFRAQRILERKLAEAFTLDGDPWRERDHQYVTQVQIRKMRAMSKEGRPIAQIAREVGVASTTVYRWIGNDRPSKAKKKRSVRTR
jgi:hypothetical protein